MKKKKIVLVHYFSRAWLSKGKQFETEGVCFLVDLDRSKLPVTDMQLLRCLFWLRVKEYIKGIIGLPIQALGKYGHTTQHFWVVYCLYPKLDNHYTHMLPSSLNVSPFLRENALNACFIRKLSLISHTTPFILTFTTIYNYLWGLGFGNMHTFLLDFLKD